MSDRDELQASFEAYVAARRGALLRTAYLLTGDSHAAEDLVQNALLNVVAKWHRIVDDPDPYVRTVLTRESVNRWRRRRWREVHTDVLPDGAVRDDDRHDDRLVLRAALARLAPRQRAVIVLRYYEDLTEAQTAAALGISVGTVKSQARDALARLRTQAPELADGEDAGVDGHPLPTRQPVPGDLSGL
ncbi:SigE family RNA polymerase sigma factor [Nocardioides aromaticivorans]|uniref:SigE family RNA polymerase sigma factor n=1 Tax=Nocardioides aromaticivorans TaxID=200618 RepID=A0ABX7PKF5_9ACTN|nr:SigE family RNA polymerase sigma factor [Nocardioides aromaticivorans]QSR26227.1 SigE family RNA polymerase sigma factor [Nocardioides aromaticivorans]